MTYDISFTAEGFKPETFRAVKVEASNNIEMTPLNMGVDTPCSVSVERPAEIIRGSDEHKEPPQFHKKRRTFLRWWRKS